MLVPIDIAQIPIGVKLDFSPSVFPPRMSSNEKSDTLCPAPDMRFIPFHRKICHNSVIEIWTGSALRSVLVLLQLGGIYRALSRHLIGFEVFVIGGALVDEGAVRKDLHDPVRGGLHHLMIPTGK